MATPELKELDCKCTGYDLYMNQKCSGCRTNEFNANVMREAVAAERERCAGIIDREREEDGDPQQLRNLLAAIREGAVSDAPAAKTAPVERLIFTDQDGDRLEVARVFGMGEKMGALYVRDPNDPDDECGVNINVENATKLRDWLNEFLL